ncbi:MAG: DUF3422 domain-containing protein [Burkholderiaceae bacterium]|nr:DUF3422 domain-containing protein [Burkholderiaceae bacterium]
MTDHPDRKALHDEIHARPRQAIAAPHRVSHIALLRPAPAGSGNGGNTKTPVDPLAALCAAHGMPSPSAGDTHFLADFGAFRLKRERHGEFDGYTIDAKGCDADDPFGRTAIDELPPGWLASLPGERIAAVHLALLSARDGSSQRADDAPALARAFDDNELCAATIAEGEARVYTDFRMREDGFVPMLLLDVSMDAKRTGREVQRLVEIEVYRMMAMLAFPLARETAVELDKAERALGSLVSRLEGAPISEEPELLQEVTHLAAVVERLSATVGFRFGAARAYHAIVRQRGQDLRVGRISPLQTPIAFLERRFDPAMAFCESVGRRIDSAAERIARASALLRTRVDIERERHNQALLSAMNRRAALQLKLQQTVEGLSVAAITYYAVGIVHYLLVAARAGGIDLDVDVATGIAVVPVAIAVALGVRHIRESVGRRLRETPSDPRYD